MGLFSFLNQFNSNSINQDGDNNFTLDIKKNKDKPISYEKLCCSNIPKELRNLFFEFFTQFIQESTSNTSSVNTHLSLHNFIEILVHRYDLPFFIPIVSFIYINRLIRIPNASAVLSEFTPNRLTAVAIIIASKYYLEDTMYIRNSKWISKVCMGLFKTGELNSLECLFLRSLDYRINVSYSEWKEYLEQIDKGLHELRLKHDMNMESEDSSINTSNKNIVASSKSNQPQQSYLKENKINNTIQLFSLLDDYILDDNQLISYPPTRQPNFSVLYHLFETPSPTTTSSQELFIHNSEIEKIKNNSSSDQDTNFIAPEDDKIMDEDKPIIKTHSKARSRMEKQSNYQYSGILTPPSSSSSSTSSQSVASGRPRSHSSSTSCSSAKMNQIDFGDDQDITLMDSNGEERLGITSDNTSSTLAKKSTPSSCYHDRTPSSKHKTTPISSLYQHNPDLKNSLDNYTMTGRLTAGHVNHYTGNRYHPFSRPANRTPSESKRNGLPLFSPVKTLDKPVTAVSPYVYSLLHQTPPSKMKSNKHGVSPGESEAQMFVSPIPNIFQDNEGGRERTNVIKSFSIIDDDTKGLKNVSNQMSVEDIAARYSLVKSKNTREHTKSRLHKSAGRASLPFSNRNHRHRRHPSSYKTQAYPTSTTDTTNPMNATTEEDNSCDAANLSLRLGVSKKSKLISKNAKLSIPKAAKNQKLFSSYLNSMMKQTVTGGGSEGPSSPTTHSSISTSTTTTFLNRFPTISKLFHRFSMRKEKKAVS